jgi:tRNA modification GTPase
MTTSASHNTDTIVALSTPRGYSGIGVIRMSGPQALELLQKVFITSEPGRRFPDRTAVYGKIVNPEHGTVLDEGLAVVMRAPASYTGEDVVELSLHGSPVVLEAVLRLVTRLGARLATRGEFTRRAYLSGRFDLVQAEAVIDVIEARSLGAAQEALSNLNSRLSREIRNVSAALKDILAMVEAHIDFDDDEEEPVPHVGESVQELLHSIEALIRRGEAARVRREGVNAVIAGKPNVGKSTLFNALVGSDRVIVTPYPGTTRDLVDDYLLLGDLCFLLCDTAGLREQPEPIEAEGIHRSRDRIAEADVVLAVVDGSSPLQDEDLAVLADCRDKKTIVVLNKSDLGLVVDSAISAKTHENLELLEDLMKKAGNDLLNADSGQAEGGVSSRGLLLLESSAACLRNLDAAFRQHSGPEPEILALELRRALAPLEEITGENVDEGILDRIFERFCVGK